VQSSASDKESSDDAQSPSLNSPAADKDKEDAVLDKKEAHVLDLWNVLVEATNVWASK
jgi:hypothetical protein